MKVFMLEEIYFVATVLLGADVVFYSVTKNMYGHSEVLGGALVTNNGAITNV